MGDVAGDCGYGAGQRFCHHQQALAAIGEKVKAALDRHVVGCAAGKGQADGLNLAGLEAGGLLADGQHGGVMRIEGAVDQIEDALSAKGRNARPVGPDNAAPRRIPQPGRTCVMAKVLKGAGAKRGHQTQSAKQDLVWRGPERPSPHLKSLQ